MINRCLLPVALFLTAASWNPLQAQVLLINTGSATVSSAQATNAPYTTGLSSTSSWNNVSADVGSGLLWADGAAASGISIDVGGSGTSFAGGTSSLNFANNVTSNAGTAFSTLAANGTAQKDFIFTGSSGQNTAVGLRIGGLTAGTYNVYVTGWNSNAATLNRSQQFWAGATSASTTTFAVGDLTLANGFQNESITNSGMGTWGEGSNYSLMQVTLDPGEYLTIIANGTNAAELRGFLNLVQIETVSTIPEPSGVALIGLGFAGLFLAKRRRRIGIA